MVAEEDELTRLRERVAELEAALATGRARSDRAAKIMAYCDRGGYATTIDGLLVALGDKDHILQMERFRCDDLIEAVELLKERYDFYSGDGAMDAARLDARIEAIADARKADEESRRHSLNRPSAIT
jgi:hypothetical protein